MELPDINLIQHFIVTARLQSYSAAARELYISRQALTRNIRRMENMLGGKLFEQKGSHLTLTALGVQLRKFAMPLCKSWDEFAWNMQHLAAEEQAILKLAVSQGVLMSIGTDIPSKFKEMYPNVLLSLEEALPDNVCDLVRNGTVELGIVGSIPSYLKDFSSLCLRESGMWLMVHESHPLARNEVIHPEDLGHYPITAPGLSNHQYRYFLELCNSAGVRPNITALITYSASAGMAPPEPEMVYFGFPPSIAPLPEGWCVRQFCGAAGHAFGTYLIAKAGASLSEPAEMLVEFLTEMLGVDGELR